jgi:transcriptional regulator
LYVPAHFAETRLEVLHQLIRERSQAVLVTLGTEGLNANHVPFLLSADGPSFGTLRAHLARSNPMWGDFSGDVDALAVFEGPQAYITPSWYRSKQEHGKVVPTYNYIAVHAYGRLRVVEDREWLRDLVHRLTDKFETPRSQRWKVTDAPEDFIETMLGAIVGLEMPVTRLIGKWKASQNRPEADRIGVARGLRENGDEEAVAMAGLVEMSSPS